VLICAGSNVSPIVIGLPTNLWRAEMRPGIKIQ
jgi:hypothetical protein